MRDFLNVTAHMIGKASGSNSATHIQSCIKRARHDGNIYSSSPQGVLEHMFEKTSGSNIATHNQSCTKRARHDGNIYSSSSQGGITLPNGKWAAHVYDNDNWNLQGIYETEKEAVIADENTNLNILMECRKPSFEGITNGAQEPPTLEKADIDTIHSFSSGSIPQEYRRTHLFGKVLTTSDVRGDKLIVPKIYAGCFPSFYNEDEPNLELQPVNEVELGFYDRYMTLWKFRYCYWRKCKTYTFSRGWRKFVKEKGLSLGDTVIFFKCECVEATSIVDTHFIIDVEYANQAQVEEVGGNMVKSVVCGSSEGVHILQNVENGGGTVDAGHVTKNQADKDLRGAGAIDVEYANQVRVEEVGGNIGKSIVCSGSEGVQIFQNEENGGVTADARHVTEIPADKELKGAGAGTGDRMETGKASEASVKLFGVKVAGAGKASEPSVKLFGVKIAGAEAESGTLEASEKSVKLFGVKIAGAGTESRARRAETGAGKASETSFKLFGVKIA